jgi:hypothetical protein
MVLDFTSLRLPSTSEGMMEGRLALMRRMMRSTMAERDVLCSSERLPGGLLGTRVVCPISPAVWNVP